MAYMLAPLNTHYDDGFGAVAEAFYAAGRALVKANEGERMFWNHLPEVFLVRHSIELFLKSGIIVIHRKLRLPFGTEPHSTSNYSLLSSRGEWKPLKNTHNLPELYAYWKKLFTEHKGALTDATKYKPDLSIPTELDSAIKVICAVDPNAEYFRYPVSTNRGADTQKSNFKEVAFEDLFPEGDNGRKVKALITEDEEGNVVRIFKNDEFTNEELRKATWIAAKILNDFHALTRFEFTDGW